MHLCCFLLPGDQWQLTATSREGGSERRGHFCFYWDVLQVGKVWTSYSERERSWQHLSSWCVRWRQETWLWALFCQLPPPTCSSTPPRAASAACLAHSGRLQAPRSHAAPHATWLFCCCWSIFTSRLWAWEPLSSRCLVFGRSVE